MSMSAPFPFHPRDFGLESHASSTACHRGYWCEFAIADRELRLQTLYLYNENDHYPPFLGKLVSPQEFREVTYSVGEKTYTRLSPAHYGHRVYRDVDLPIPYTGSILLGCGFMPEYYVHGGFQRSWAYRELIELTFEKGKLTDCLDQSHLAQAQRQRMQRQ